MAQGNGIEFDEIWQALSEKDREYIKKLGEFLIEQRVTKRPGQAILHINGNGFLSELKLDRSETLKF